MPVFILPQYMVEEHDERNYIDYIVVVHNMSQPNRLIVNAVSANPIHKFDVVSAIMNMHIVPLL